MMTEYNESFSATVLSVKHDDESFNYDGSMMSLAYLPVASILLLDASSLRPT